VGSGEVQWQEYRTEWLEGENIIKSGPAPKPGWGKSFAPESERKWRDGQEAGKKVMEN
jgi:hypothetical protein